MYDFGDYSITMPEQAAQTIKPAPRMPPELMQLPSILPTRMILFLFHVSNWALWCQQQGQIKPDWCLHFAGLLLKVEQQTCCNS